MDEKTLSYGCLFCQKGAKKTVSIHIHQTMTEIEGIASAQIGRLSLRKKSVKEPIPKKLLICMGMPARG